MMIDHKLSIYNRKILESVHLCGCFSCIRVFPVTAIKEWTDKGQTALCPNCTIDSILPETVDISKASLTRMCERWFAGHKS